MIPQQAVFAFDGAGQLSCPRCGRPCRVNPSAGSKATILKRASKHNGLCLNCAVHDVLRNLYPANLILARSGPWGLSLPPLQREFFEICRAAGTDARFEDIDWQAIIAHWDLPFPTPVQRTAFNAATEEDLAMARREGVEKRAGTWKEPETEEEYEIKLKAAENEVINCLRRVSHEDP